MQLDLTELELKAVWLVLAQTELSAALPHGLRSAGEEAFNKVYRAYRAMPPQEAA